MDPHHPRISIRRQCDLLGLNRSSYYVGDSWGTQTQENLEIMERLDRQYTAVPTYGSRRMTAWLRREGYDVNRKRIQRLMRLMGLEGGSSSSRMGCFPGPRKPQLHLSVDQ